MPFASTAPLPTPTSQRPRRLRRGRLLRHLAAAAAIAAGAATMAAGGAHAAETPVWDRLAQCESSGNWQANTGNGYFGGLQFKASTWDEFGGTSYAPTADQATRDQQITVARKVLAQQGPRAWPVCSLKVGLTHAHATIDEPTTSHELQAAPAPVAPTGQMYRNGEPITRAVHDSATPTARARAVYPLPGAQAGAAFGESGSMWSNDHTGQDYVAPAGAPIHAALTGTVVTSGWGGAYGNQVVIHHQDGTYTQYAHLSETLVHTGQRLETGRVIGRVGSTGNSTGPHLHFETRTTPHYGSATNPTIWLTNHGAQP